MNQMCLFDRDRINQINQLFDCRILLKFTYGELPLIWTGFNLVTACQKLRNQRIVCKS